MKYVLLIADGDIALHFLRKILSVYSSNNFYVVLYKDERFLPREAPNTFRFYKCDYTSYFRLDNILADYDISDGFIVLDDESEGAVVYEYLRKKYKHIRIIQSIHALNEEYENLNKKDSNLILITQTNAMASRLLLRVPNVPVIARGFGLEQGEIMEIGVPNGSVLAHRQIDSIKRGNWRVVGIYRRNEFILANKNEVIHPGDRILVAGNPEELQNLYKRVKSEMGQFPSPFGREMYLIIDMSLQSKDRILFDCKEAIFLHRHLKSTKLTIKVLHAGNFELISQIEKLAKKDIFVIIDYENLNFTQTLYNKFDKKVGLIILGSEFFIKRAYRKVLYESKIPVFRSGLNSLASPDFDMYSMDEEGQNEDSKIDSDNIKKFMPNVAYSMLVIAGNGRNSRDISTLIFDISKQLNLDVHVYDFEPDNHFNAQIEEEFNNLSRIFERKFYIEKSNSQNPIFYLQNLQTPVLHFVPFSRAVTKSRISSLFGINFESLAFSLDFNPQFYLPLSD